MLSPQAYEAEASVVIDLSAAKQTDLSSLVVAVLLMMHLVLSRR